MYLGGPKQVYIIKYGLGPREHPRAQPEGTPEVSGHNFFVYTESSSNMAITAFLTMIVQ